MKPHIILPSAFLLLLLAGCDSGAPGANDAAALSPAAQQPLIHDLTGTWFGRLGIVAPNMVLADFTEQDRRRFFGVVATPEGEFSTAGTISAAGVVSLIGIPDGTSNTFTGLYRLADFGSGAAALLGTAHTGSGDGRTDQFLLRQLDFDAATDPEPPSVAGGWEGSFSSNVNGDPVELEASFEMGTNGAPTRFRGMLSFGDEPTIVEGSINGDGDILIVAMGVGTSPGFFLVLEGFHTPEIPSGDDVIPPTPAKIEGTYSILQCPIVSPVCLPRPGDSTLADSGTFNIIAILIG